MPVEARGTGRAGWALLAVLLLGCTRYGFGPPRDRGAVPDAPRDQPAVQDLARERVRDAAADRAADARRDQPRLDGPSLDRPDKSPAPDQPPLPDKPKPLPDKPPKDQPPLFTGDGSPPLAWVSVPAGLFYMGSLGSEHCRTTFETLHKVTLTRSFEISNRETTSADFYAVMAYSPTAVSCVDCPVVNVSWHEAAAYCNKLSLKSGRAPCYVCTGSAAAVTCADATAYAGTAIYTCPGYRLPTEAEWERAYRAGTTTAYYNGPNNSTTCTSCTTLDSNLAAIGWYCANSQGVVHAVGKKAPSSWGLYDMAGNVWEWCHDTFTADLFSTAVTDPVTTAGLSRVLRGGAFALQAMYARGAARISEDPTARFEDTGFRCVRTLP